MRYRVLLITVLTYSTIACSPPGRPASDSRVVPPGKITDFDILYGENCAACHGANGRGGAAIGLGDPVYLAVADDVTIRRVTANGVKGTPMPAFAQSSGGLLSDAQVDAIVKGMRTQWSRSDIASSLNPPPYAARVTGDAERGATVYSAYCSSCHGVDGRGGPKGSSIVDGSYLALVSDQGLRTAVIVGRPEFGFPDWRGDAPNQQMSSEDISDVVAWLTEQRPQFPGQPFASAQPATGGVQ